MTDSVLIKRAQQGDRDAFERLLVMHYDTIFRFALKWTAHRQNAEDIAQLACMKVAKSLSNFKFESAFTTWLYRLVVNCAIDWQRSQARHETHRAHADDTLAWLNSQPSREATPELNAHLCSLLAWLENVGDAMKETALLVFGEGFNHREAADILNIKESTVSWRIHEIRKQLRQTFGPEEQAL